MNEQPNGAYESADRSRPDRFRVQQPTRRPFCNLVAKSLLVGAAGLLLVAATAASGTGLGNGSIHVAESDSLPPSDSVQGYIAMLLINEAPFPGEPSWVSEDDSKACMLAILWVLHSRLKEVPPGYTQSQIASQRCEDIIAVITAGGEKGQCDGFYKDSSGKFVAVRRVHERIDYLVKCAGRGAPGRFARLLQYAEDLTAAYLKDGVAGADRFAGLSRVGAVPVTGRAYSWMTDRNGYNPGGNFVRIPDSDEGSLGGNRFFTLRKLK